jgi:Short C-terminal domain
MVGRDADAGAAGAEPAPDPDEIHQEAVADAEAAVREAEAEAEAAERAAEQYSTLQGTSDQGSEVSELDELARLRDSGVLSETEFQAAKDRLLGGR